MSQVLILCTQAMQARAARLAAALELPSDSVEPVDTQRTAREVQARSGSTRCFLVCWSHDFRIDGTAWQKPVAAAHVESRVVSLSLDGTAEPGSGTPLDFSRWRGSANAAQIAVLRDRIRPCLAPRKRKWRMFGLIALPPVALYVGFFVDLTSIGGDLCRIGLVRPLCAYLAIGGIPSHAQEQSFRRARANGCDQLRRLVRDEPGNPLAADARRLVDAVIVERRSTWEPRSQSLPLYVAGAESGSRPAAEAQVRAAAAEAAASQCAHLEAARTMRVAGSRADVRLDCSRQSTGWRCAADGQAQCRILERRIVVRERCG